MTSCIDTYGVTTVLSKILVRGPEESCELVQETLRRQKQTDETQGINLWAC